jgi:hypothetical protein
MAAAEWYAMLRLAAALAHIRLTDGGVCYLAADLDLITIMESAGSIRFVA